jgi:outer membrane receptor protein involved in Fe transport
VRGLAGLFYEDQKIYDATDWRYKTMPDCSPDGPTSSCFLPVGPPPGATVSDPNVRNAATAYFQDFERTFTQKAAFGSVSFDILPKVLTITGGIRYFDMYTSLAGAQAGSFGCKQFTPTTYFGRCLTSATGYTVDRSLVETGHLGRADLAWHITPDLLAYYTYSQGFRPGGINSAIEQLLPDQNGNPRYQVPETYASDLVTNNEIGWKTEWFDHRVRFNGALYEERWSNVQTYLFCPQCGLGIIPFTVNGPDYRVRGVELQLVAQPTKGLTVQGSAAWNSSELLNSPQLIANIPTSPEFGQPITHQYVSGVAIPIPNVYGEVGSPLANSPPMAANMRVRYERLVGDYLPYVQAGFQHQAHSLSGTGLVRQFEQPAWTTYDASIGVSRGNWTVSLVGVNLTDVNKSLYTTDVQFILTETPIRPRTVMLTFNYTFSESH